MTMINPTRHLRRPLRRYWRSRALSLDVPDTPTLSGSSHCLTMRVIDAEARLHTRLENQRVLSHTADKGALKSGLTSIPVCAELVVALTKGGEIEKLLSCVEICCNTTRVASEEDGCRS